MNDKLMADHFFEDLTFFLQIISKFVCLHNRNDGEELFFTRNFVLLRQKSFQFSRNQGK
jgi:hypothetical protein